MNYQIRKEDLQNDLLAETLQALFHCYNQLQLPLYVVGASARDIALRLLNVANTPRRTLDLDVAVALHCRLEPSPRKNKSRGLPKVHLSCLFGVSRM